MNAHPDDVLAALRAATASRHAVLDSGLPLSQPGATLADYRDHLAMLRRWLQPIAALDARYRDGPQDPALLAPLDRLRLIEVDLAHPSLAAAEGQAAPAAGGAGSLADACGTAGAAYRWGVAYVLEGSQLGGQVLYRRLASQLAPHPLHYLHGEGVPPGPRWQHFLKQLRAQVTGPDQIAEACAGACDAFDALMALRPGLARAA